MDRHRRNFSSPALKHRVAKVITPAPKSTAKIVVGMDNSFPGILREGTAQSEPTCVGIASYPPFQPKVASYLWVASHPQYCVNRILISSAFKRKSKRTLRRLAFSRCLYIRYAAEMEIILRELIEHHFP
jgi:hypothetical protein